MSADIDLMRPVRSERVRGFQPPWRTVFVYRCDAGHEVRVHASSYRGNRPEPARGAIRCPQCDRCDQRGTALQCGTCARVGGDA